MPEIVTYEPSWALDAVVPAAYDVVLLIALGAPLMKTPSAVWLTPCSVKPLRSSVTLLALIVMPFCPEGR